MADLMQQAREILAAEIGVPVTAGSFFGTLPAGVHSDAAIRAIAAALRAAPEGFVLVPVACTRAMREAWDGAPDSEDDDVAFSNAYAAMLAARPQGVNP